MPLLGDYLGHLLSEITIARVQADLEAARIAELYASHPLLKSMPIPRFRVPTIALDVPVSVAGMEEPKPGESPRGDVPADKLRERFGELLTQHLERNKISLSDTQRTQLDQALDRTMSATAVPSYLPQSSIHMADELVSTVVNTVDGPADAKAAAGPTLEKEFADELRAAARLEFLNLREAPPRLQVLVTTAELREAPKELLAQLHLSISEEAFEWSLSDSQGVTRSRLVPE
jgi:hypothetical protein